MRRKILKNAVYNWTKDRAPVQFHIVISSIEQVPNKSLLVAVQFTNDSSEDQASNVIIGYAWSEDLGQRFKYLETDSEKFARIALPPISPPVGVSGLKLQIVAWNPKFNSKDVACDILLESKIQSSPATSYHVLTAGDEDGRIT